MPPKDNSERACEECIHYWACSRQCDEPMAQRSANGCECYETVKSIAAARLIERLTAENAALREKQRWISATEPPKEWKDEKTGYMINYLINCVYSGVDVGSYHAEAGCWLCRGLPVTVTHWMPMPEAPEEHNGKENS